jgi:hypothetical protein
MESFRGEQHLRRIAIEAQTMVDTALAAGTAAVPHTEKSGRHEHIRPDGK